MQVPERDIRLEDLDRYAAVKTEMLRVINHPHSADADERFDMVLFNDSTADKVVGVAKREQFSIIQAETLWLLIRMLALRAIFCRHFRSYIFSFSKIGR